MQNKYPQILLPQKVHSIKRMFPPLPPEPIQPKCPEKKIPQKPNEPDKPFGIGTAFLIVIVVIGVGLALGFVIPLLGLFLIGLAIYLVFSWSKNWSSIHNKYNEDYKKYLEDCQNFDYLIANCEKLYNNEIQYYNNVLLPQYKADYSTYLQKKQKLESKPSIDKYRNSELSDFFLEAIKPHKIADENNYNKGLTEEFFHNYLRDNFNENVYTNFSIIDPVFESIPYQPDFVISVPDINLFIDIEIDEPYVGSDGTPIHYLNGNDNFRNTFFLKNQWVIIRFAEIQIVKFPQKCCEVIQSTIDWVKNTDESDILEITRRIENFKCWTKKEAHRLAFTRFRNKYLPQKLTEKINSEIMELEKKFLNIKSETFEADLPY